MKIFKRRGAAIAVALGLVAFLVGTSLVMLRDGGWPWHASIGGDLSAGVMTAEVVDDDGAAYRFTGAPADAQRWLDDKQVELKEAHGIPGKIAVGEVLQPAGVVLVLIGLAGLLWRSVTFRRARRAGGLPWTT
ncbi:hypothetical protein AB0J80_19185 [Actinoplanes sp. NPDC049548]|uniref:hypothetical protein n=1 Tax=Actinoplanes sp. NPDC049548 TaxID=3155152 RepID=UPI00341D3367